VSVVVFTGPTLSHEDARAVLPRATLLGPAECGDVYLVAKRRPEAIALIDGYFDHRLSVWHKEILWALARRTPVYGAASMGALRAAELARFGMIGVGQVYESFRRGELEDDDEVAVLHEPAERGYRVRSDAMVNLRATLRAAVADGALEPALEARLVLESKRLFYADRSFGAVLAEARTFGFPQHERLRLWFEQRGVVDQKRADALALLERLSVLGAETQPATAVDFHFERTNYWCALTRSLDRTGRAPDVAAPARPRRAPEPRPAQRAPGKDPLDVLERLHAAYPDEAPELEHLALARALALLVARLRGISASPADVQLESERIRRRLGLFTPEQTAEWLQQSELDLERFSVLAHERALEQLSSDEVKRAMAAQLANLLLELGLPALR
jgi:hypothetical protein